MEYPADWNPDSEREAPHGCVFRGASGYVQVSYFGGPTDAPGRESPERRLGRAPEGSRPTAAAYEFTLDSGAELHASHHLKPFGSEPRIATLLVDRQPGRLILPSADQDPSFEGIAELLVELPESIATDVGWSMLMIYANRELIEEIAARIRFG